MARVVKKIAAPPMCAIAVLLLLAICLGHFIYTPIVAAQDAGHAAVAKLTLKARHIEDTGDLDAAEKGYEAALLEAKRVDSKRDQIEIISRLVRVKIDNHKLMQTGPLVQEAIDIVNLLKNPPVAKPSMWDNIVSVVFKPKEPEKYTPESSVWMNDMAETFYNQGEKTEAEEVKLFCLKRHLDLRLPVIEKWDPQYMSKLSVLTNYLASEGLYSDAVPYAERQQAYLERFKHDPGSMAVGYLTLGTFYAAADFYSKAENAYNSSRKFYELLIQNPDKSPYLIDVQFGSLKLTQGMIPAARTFYLKAKRQCEREGGPTNPDLARINVMLGILERCAGNLDKAAEYYRMSLACSDKISQLAANPLNPGGNKAAGVLGAEELASLLVQKHGDLDLVRSLIAQAKGVRAEHQEWRTKNPNPEKFFLVWHSLPFRVELIQTKTGH